MVAAGLIIRNAPKYRAVATAPGHHPKTKTPQANLRGLVKNLSLSRGRRSLPPGQPSSASLQRASSSKPL
jgi:hypothetical protein